MATRLCAVSDVPKGGALRVELGDDVEIAVVRTDDGQVFAVEDVCSHANFPLSDGEVNGCTLECALHGSFFDLRTGDPIGGPATQPITTYLVTVVDDQVYVDLE